MPDFTPVINLFIVIIVGIYQGLSLLHIPYALGFSIIIFTILTRFLLYPLTAAQLKSAKKMQGLTPHLNRLKEKHKNDGKRLQAETMNLYKEHGINPAAGCIPLIIQMPIILILYQALNKILNFNSPHVVVSEINKIGFLPDAFKLSQAWDPTFFGLPLGQHPSQLMSTLGPLILLVPILTGVFQFIQSKMMIVKNKDQEQDKPKKEDFASAFQKQSLFIFPAMIGFFSFNFPIGLSLYWNTFTIFGILQQYKVSGLGGLAEWKDKIWQKPISQLAEKKK
ncbi:MAG: YidC/Oxa1 family membrane protein insertase [Candidatus Levyibacteriota bacterium]